MLKIVTATSVVSWGRIHLGMLAYRFTEVRPGNVGVSAVNFMLSDDL